MFLFLLLPIKLSAIDIVDTAFERQCRLTKPGATLVMACCSLLCCCACSWCWRYWESEKVYSIFIYVMILFISLLIELLKTDRFMEGSKLDPVATSISTSPELEQGLHWWEGDIRSNLELTILLSPLQAWLSDSTCCEDACIFHVQKVLQEGVLRWELSTVRTSFSPCFQSEC